MTIDQIARRFPLVPRPRPACPPLTERVQEISDLARVAVDDRTLSAAATVQNKAALIASDCGLPTLASDLCWRHFESYSHAQPLGARPARLALEPLVNRARLLIRHSDPHSAYRLLDKLNQAVRARTHMILDGHLLTFDKFIASDEDHHHVCQWLWTVRLAEGTRALVAADQWDRALTHARQHRGVGSRLLDGRQVEVIARCLAGEPTSALECLRQSTLSEEWEPSVAACLSVLCLIAANLPAQAAAATMVTLRPRLGSKPELAVFHTRLSLSVLDLIAEIDRIDETNVIAPLMQEAIASGDGYVARDVLAHERCRELLQPADGQILTDTLTCAGLDRGMMPEELKQQLLEAITVSETTIRRALTSPH